MEKKPILWLRLVAWANSCNALIKRLGDERVFPWANFPARQLIAKAGDSFIDAHLDDYAERIESLMLVEL